MNCGVLLLKLELISNGGVIAPLLGDLGSSVARIYGIGTHRPEKQEIVAREAAKGHRPIVGAPAPCRV
jgi:hypothetical protein